MWLSLLLLLAAAFAIDSSLLAEIKCEVAGSAAPRQKILSDVRSETVQLSGSPRALIHSTSHNDVAFATIHGQDGKSNWLEVLDVEFLEPRIRSHIKLPARYVDVGGAQAMSLLPGGQHLLIAAGVGAIVVDANAAAMGRSDAIVGFLNGTGSREHAGKEAAAVISSSDGQYVFVSQEWGEDTGVRGFAPGNIIVMRLSQVEHDQSRSSSFIGLLSLGLAVNDLTLSPDGRTLYATSEQGAPGIYHGSLSVIDVDVLKTNPSSALLTSVSVGCGAVRSIVSSDGTTIWVTSREDNKLMAFDTWQLRHHRIPFRAAAYNITPIVDVTVGTSPIGLTFARNESRILLADSNRFGISGASSGVSVVDATAALEGRGQESVLGSISAGSFPRDLALSPDGSTVLLANYDSYDVQAIDIATLP